MNNSTAIKPAFTSALHSAVEGLGLALTPGQVDMLYQHYCSVVETNRITNLTRITEPAEAAIKHVADSLALVAWLTKRLPAGTTLLDVGTGAGYPAIPIAIVRPDWQITAIDSTKKKTDFVARVVCDLSLTNLRVFHARAEHWDTSRRFDVIAMRAVSSMAEGMKKCIKLIVESGLIVFYKSAELPHDEAASAQSTARKFHLECVDRYTYELQSNGETLKRALWVWEKS